MRQPRPTPLLELEPAAFRPARKGRGARVNPTGRFEKAQLEWDLDAALATPEGQEAGRALLADERRFIDLENSPLFVGDEKPLVGP